ncbi:MAG TPA: DUF3027 domain-containing protein, partial [Actinomycetota bacterium]|nr:DUF3027 domain-containing protein [Actinomycetota bacterium]
MTDDPQEHEGLATVVVGDRPMDETPASPALTWEVDEICAHAVDLARAAVLEQTGPATVGDHCGVVSEGPSVVTHFFEGHVPGYAGWRWAVTVARAPDSSAVTIDEVVLLPDGDALLAPSWVPWKQRIQSGDLGAGDVLVTEPDDPRLVPGLADNDVPEADDGMLPAQWELGLGRVRILSPEGRRDAAVRWYRDAGPRSPAARATGMQCASCGFLLMIGGPMGQAFGVCANGYSPADGRVVALTFGCGAHSETVQRASVGVAETVVDDFGYDDLGPSEPADPVAPEAGDGDAGGEDRAGPEQPALGEAEGPAGSDGPGQGAATPVDEAAGVVDEAAGPGDEPPQETVHE